MLKDLKEVFTCDELRRWGHYPPAELLRIAEYHTAWRAHSYGAQHPSLLCARLGGERLGDWAAAVEVAEGVLAIEAFNPLLRTEALRLLGRAHDALGAAPRELLAAPELLRLERPELRRARGGLLRARAHLGPHRRRALAEQSRNMWNSNCKTPIHNALIKGHPHTYNALI